MCPARGPALSSHCQTKDNPEERETQSGLDQTMISKQLIL